MKYPQPHRQYNVYCLPALIILCGMTFLASMAKHKEAEKRVFERKKFLDKRLRSVLLENPNPQIRRGDEQRGAIRQMRRTGFAFGKPCDRRKPSAQTQAIIDYVQKNK